MRNDNVILFEIPGADHRLEEICLQGLRLIYCVMMKEYIQR